MTDQDELNKFDWLLDDLVDIGGVDGVEARDRQCAIKVKLAEMFERQQAAAREADRLRAENALFRERLSLIYGLTYDRDGLTTAESLGQLVDEVCQITQGMMDGEGREDEGSDLSGEAPNHLAGDQISP